VLADRVAEGRRRLEATLDRSQRLAEADIEQTVQGLSNLLYLAEAQRKLDEPAPALELYRRARARSEEWRKPYFDWQVTTGLAALHLSQQRYDEALAEARRGVEQVESLRRSIEDETQRVYYLRQRSNVYAILASALDRRYGAAAAGEVLETLERVHSRTLREALGARSDAGTDGHSVPLEGIQRSLLPRDVLVEYLLGEDESLLLVVSRHAARLHRLPPRARIEDLVERYRRVLQRPLVSLDARVDPEGDFSRTASPGRELFEILLGPAAEELARSDRLIVVPDKQLHRLPFEALPVADGFVGAGAHAVLYLPAASFLVEPRAPSAAAKGVVLLAAGAADPALGLAELSEISTEVERIRRAHDARTLRVLEGPAATYEGLRQALEGPVVRTLHIAGHALSDPSSGPQIVLAGRSLSVAEILDLAPTPPLVVLSACETGEGELVGGEGILGLVRAFHLSGSTQTVASLWKADDSAAAELMGDFHAGLERGEPPSRALARARHELLARGFVHPFAWAAFVLYGAD
jgi:CHAT domain-containing protein